MKKSKKMSFQRIEDVLICVFLVGFAVSYSWLCIGSTVSAEMSHKEQAVACQTEVYAFIEQRGLIVVSPFNWVSDGSLPVTSVDVFNREVLGSSDLKSSGFIYCNSLVWRRNVYAFLDRASALNVSTINYVVARVNAKYFAYLYYVYSGGIYEVQVSYND